MTYQQKSDRQSIPNPFPRIADQLYDVLPRSCILCGELKPAVSVRGLVFPRNHQQAAWFRVRFGEGLFFTACAEHRLDLDSVRLEIESRLAHIMNRRAEALATAGVGGAL